MAVSRWMSLSSHHPSCLHSYGHSLGAVQAVSGVIEAPSWTQPQAEAIGRPHPTVKVSPLVVSILGGLGAALGRDGDEGFGGGARWYWRWGLLVARCVGDC